MLPLQPIAVGPPAGPTLPPDPGFDSGTAAVPATGDTSSTDHVERLATLLESTGRLRLDDPRGWAELRDAAAALTTELAGDGRLTPALVIAPTDPPVVVARSLLRATRGLSGG